ncbi:hypothetical protein PAXRUDRAFT_18567 [Paxillus rubicundulus Ve08.2h10]|uniref:Uncharacterized protein n=1 Tax=Paxillus rubicundulus Ve08.2h10 TaxID=930991 RepID=A0A0D0CXN5_9AGAM|nr:hypothetical protein PAXRUDRAFT_18567 [Paxillus rubicundulus Ve08.2h10]
MKYLWDEFDPAVDVDDEDDKVGGHKGEKAKMEKDSLGALILPPYSSLKLPGQKDAIQQIMHEAYVKHTNNLHACVPWRLLIDTFDFIHEDCLPDDLDEFPNPSKLISSQVQPIWNLWLAHQAKGEPMVVFTRCKKGDLRADVEEKLICCKKGKKKDYVEIDEENNRGQSVGEGEGVDICTTSPGGHLDPQSPAAHTSDKQTQVTFLQTLSKAKTYQDLVLLSSSMLTKPALCPEGLLLHDIAKVIELEPDVDPIPPYFGQSPFSHQHLDQVLATVQETKDRITAVISSSKRSLPTDISTMSPPPPEVVPQTHESTVIIQEIEVSAQDRQRTPASNKLPEGSKEV